MTATAYLRLAGTAARPTMPPDATAVARARPYADLSEPTAACSALQRGLEIDARLLNDDDGVELFPRLLPALGFRAALLDGVGLASHVVDVPAELPDELRSRRWQILTDRLARPDRSYRERSVDLVVLCRLGLFEQAASQGRAALAATGRSATPDRLAATLTAAALGRLGEGSAARALLRQLLETPRAPRDRGGVLVTLLVGAAKRRPAAVSEVVAIGSSLAVAVAELEASNPGDAQSLATLSLFWRALSFVPFFDGNAAEVDRMLLRAEACAEAIVAEDDRSLLARLESLVPLCETRVKVAGGRGDTDVAVAYAERLVHLDPLSATAHLRLGHLFLAADQPAKACAAYERAMAIGPPATPQAHHFAGVAREALGDLRAAADLYRAACARDAGAVSPARRLLELGRHRGVDGAERDALAHLRRLGRCASQPTHTEHEVACS